MLDLSKIVENQLVLAKNTIFVNKGSIETNIYSISEGSVKIYIENEKENQIVRFGYKGDLIVALDSFLNEKPTEYYFETLKKTCLQKISKAKFFEFLSNSEAHRKSWIKILENLVVQQMEREIDLLTISPMERYKRVLARSPKLFQEIPNKHIANYLRMSPETLSRIKKS